ALQILQSRNSTIVAVADAVGVDRSTLHRWKKDASRIAASRTNRFFASRNTRAHVYIQTLSLCRNMKMTTFEILSFFSDNFVRFLKRNRLTVRRITHKGRIAVNNFRVSVFLAASATGKKLPPFVVFTGVPGGPVSQDVFNPNAYCDAKVIHGWIERVRTCTFHNFTNIVTILRFCYILRIVAEAWDTIPAKAIVNGFIKAGLIPIGPWDNSARFRVPQMSASDVPLVCDE
ncbi:Cytochrome P450, partial [Phytophthora megakarya]